MSTASNRGAIVLRALSLAGRGTEIRDSANEWLDDLLQSWAINYCFPSLRKIGAPSILSAGSSTAALPTDFGAGMAKLGMLFGVGRSPIAEKDEEEFITAQGFQISNGKPRFYMVDRNAGQFVFNYTADQDYSFTPIYYRMPSRIPTGLDGDTEKLWLDDENLAVQGLIAQIYQFTNDDREFRQDEKVEVLLRKYLRASNTLGGGNSRIQLSPERFKTVRFR